MRIIVCNMHPIIGYILYYILYACSVYNTVYDNMLLIYTNMMKRHFNNFEIKMNKILTTYQTVIAFQNLCLIHGKL